MADGRSPRKEARPRIAFIGTVASLPRARRRAADRAGGERLAARAPARRAWSSGRHPTCRAPSLRRWPRRRRGRDRRERLRRQLLAERHEQRAVKRARSAADLHHQRHADRLERLRQRFRGKPSSSASTASKPRFMLMPWSPSPIAWSSAVNSSAWSMTRRATVSISSFRVASPTTMTSDPVGISHSPRQMEEF